MIAKRFVITLVLAATGIGLAQESINIVATGAEMKKLAGDFQFTEGPAADAQGNVCFVDIPTNRILKWSVAEIAVPESPANLTFGGPDNRTLFITARTSLYSIATDVRGARTPIRPGDRQGNREGRQRSRGR